jgi:hypothetical protein
VLASTLGTQERAEVDALGLFSRCTLDIIGLAGFGYAFHALSPAGADDELAAAFDAISNAVRNPQLADLLALFVPGFRLLVRRHPPVICRYAYDQVADGAEQKTRQGAGHHAPNRCTAPGRAEGRRRVRALHHVPFLCG